MPAPAAAPRPAAAKPEAPRPSPRATAKVEAPEPAPRAPKATPPVKVVEGPAPAKSAKPPAPAPSPPQLIEDEDEGKAQVAAKKDPAPTEKRAPAPEKVKADRLAEARKALKLGDFDGALVATDAALAAQPKDQDVLALRKQVNALQRAISLGRVAFDAADCLGALRTLEPVLEASPGAKGVSHMVSTCKNALPPREL